MLILDHPLGKACDGFMAPTQARIRWSRWFIEFIEIVYTAPARRADHNASAEERIANHGCIQPDQSTATHIPSAQSLQEETLCTCRHAIVEIKESSQIEYLALRAQGTTPCTTGCLCGLLDKTRDVSIDNTLVDTEHECRVVGRYRRYEDVGGRKLFLPFVVVGCDSGDSQ